MSHWMAESCMSFHLVRCVRVERCCCLGASLRRDAVNEKMKFLHVALLVCACVVATRADGADVLYLVRGALPTATQATWPLLTQYAEEP